MNLDISKVTAKRLTEKEWIKAIAVGYIEPDCHVKRMGNTVTMEIKEMV